MPKANTQIKTKRAGILQISTEGAKGNTGLSAYLPRLTQELIRQGLACRLVGLSGVVDNTPEPELPYLRMFRAMPGLRKIGASSTMKYYIQKKVSCGYVNIIHCHGIWLMPPVYGRQAAMRNRIPLIVSPHGTLFDAAFRSGSVFKPIFWKLLQKKVLESANCFHATAFPEYNEIRRHGFQQPVAVIPNGVDLPQLNRKHIFGQRTLLFLGRLHPLKGIADLLYAWRTLQDHVPSWRLRIVGPDEKGHLDHMKKLAASLAVKRVEFAGEKSGADKLMEFARADLFVLPSHSENFGIAVAEALAAGVPAIVSKGAPWSAIETKGAGWWPDIGVGSLVACLQDALFRPPSELQEMGDRGRQWMEEEFSWGMIGAKMENTYRWLIYGGEKPECVKVN